MANYYPTLAVIVLSLLVILLLAREWSRMERKLRELTDRVRNLENANSKRLPHRAADELLDAMAVLDAELDKQEIEIERLKNIKAHITNAMTTGTKRQTEK